MADLIDAQLKRLVDMQGAWFEKMLQSMERMEEERLRREEAWRREEAARQERERRCIASERAWGRLGGCSASGAGGIVRRREGEGRLRWRRVEVGRGDDLGG
ncbi:hypothetical protein HPP92_001754 [Vanilla planifolia]|uniref:Uncharacterized protein n=1 Tax=Vanilla planifolia TaxID=51239 RepID=A0A835VI21_VANPL|nr:hypothetical protein HPP92_001982 [Vanilla planifolia]KAG0501682.1 hypothetical protein HPP92_001754 [Vanilla planifolia]